MSLSGSNLAVGPGFDDRVGKLGMRDMGTMEARGRVGFGGTDGDLDRGKFRGAAVCGSGRCLGETSDSAAAGESGGWAATCVGRCPIGSGPAALGGFRGR